MNKIFLTQNEVNKEIDEFVNWLNEKGNIVRIDNFFGNFIKKGYTFNDITTSYNKSDLETIIRDKGVEKDGIFVNRPIKEIEVNNDNYTTTLFFRYGIKNIAFKCVKELIDFIGDCGWYLEAISSVYHNAKKLNENEYNIFKEHENTPIALIFRPKFDVLEEANGDYVYYILPVSSNDDIGNKKTRE